MKTNSIIFILSLLFSPVLLAENSYYCSQNASYISLGMTSPQVKQACGEPANIETSNQEGKVKQPVIQMIFRVKSEPNQAGYYQLRSGATTSVVINIRDNKVLSISVGGSNAQSVSLCNPPITVGDPASRARSACGTPVGVNRTFEEVPTDETEEVEVWTYKPEYQPEKKLTFINGILQSIE